jgi:hypothetical protein
MTPTEARKLADRFENLWQPMDWDVEARDALRSLADQVEALQKDHERLEWIIAQTPIAEYSTGAKNFYLGQLPLLHSSSGNMRDAIDQAREAT